MEEQNLQEIADAPAAAYTNGQLTVAAEKPETIPLEISGNESVSSASQYAISNSIAVSITSQNQYSTNHSTDATQQYLEVDPNSWTAL